VNLLVLTNNPDRASFRQRVGVYLDMLKANGVACEVVKLPEGFLARRKLFKKAAGYEGVFLQKKRLNYFDALQLRRYSRKIIYDFDDAVMYSDRHPDRYSRSHFVPFRRTVRLADMVIAGNAYLAEYAGKFNSNLEILPTGLDTRAYKSVGAPKSGDKIRLVWIGSESTLGYLAEIKPALEEIGSRFDNVVLRIICDAFFDLQNMQVEKHPWSEQTQTIDLAGSDIGLAPLPDNPFTRGKCGFKILQYAAAALPVVASLVGVNTDYVHQGLTGFLATGPDEWISAMTTLIKDGRLRREMGKRNVEEAKRFDIDELGRQFVHLIMKCLKSAR
jgi:glycosyltransferase involved in cell wall biosynthesis